MASKTRSSGNNLLYNNHAGGLALFQQDGADGSKNNVVENNTMINAADGRYTVNITDGSTGNTLFNNIIYNLNTSSARAGRSAWTRPAPAAS